MDDVLKSGERFYDRLSAKGRAAFNNVSNLPVKPYKGTLEELMEKNLNTDFILGVLRQKIESDDAESESDEMKKILGSLKILRDDVDRIWRGEHEFSTYAMIYDKISHTLISEELTFKGKSAPTIEDRLKEKKPDKIIDDINSEVSFREQRLKDMLKEVFETKEVGQRKQGQIIKRLLSTKKFTNKRRGQVEDDLRLIGITNEVAVSAVLEQKENYMTLKTEVPDLIQKLKITKKEIDNKERIEQKKKDAKPNLYKDLTRQIRRQVDDLQDRTLSPAHTHIKDYLYKIDNPILGYTYIRSLLGKPSIQENQDDVKMLKTIRRDIKQIFRKQNPDNQYTQIFERLNGRIYRFSHGKVPEEFLESQIYLGKPDEKYRTLEELLMTGDSESIDAATCIREHMETRRKDIIQGYFNILKNMPNVEKKKKKRIFDILTNTKKFNKTQRARLDKLLFMVGMEDEILRDDYLNKAEEYAAIQIHSKEIFSALGQDYKIVRDDVSESLEKQEDKLSQKSKAPEPLEKPVPPTEVKKSIWPRVGIWAGVILGVAGATIYGWELWQNYLTNLDLTEAHNNVANTKRTLLDLEQSTQDTQLNALSTFEASKKTALEMFNQTKTSAWDSYQDAINNARIPADTLQENLDQLNGLVEKYNDIPKGSNRWNVVEQFLTEVNGSAPSNHDIYETIEKIAHTNDFYTQAEWNELFPKNAYPDGNFVVNKPKNPHFALPDTAFDVKEAVSDRFAELEQKLNAAQGQLNLEKTNAKGIYETAISEAKKAYDATVSDYESVFSKAFKKASLVLAKHRDYVTMLGLQVNDLKDQMLNLKPYALASAGLGAVIVGISTIFALRKNKKSPEGQREPDPDDGERNEILEEKEKTLQNDEPELIIPDEDFSGSGETEDPDRQGPVSYRAGDKSALNYNPIFPRSELEWMVGPSHHKVRKTPIELSDHMEIYDIRQLYRTNQMRVGKRRNKRVENNLDGLFNILSSTLDKKLITAKSTGKEIGVCASTIYKYARQLRELTGDDSLCFSNKGRLEEYLMEQVCGPQA